MKIVLLLSFCACAFLGADSLENSLKEAQIEASIRLAHIANSYSASGNDYATSLGGILKYETLPLYDVRMGVAAYISQKITSLSGSADESKLNTELLDIHGDSYVYLGEAYLDYSIENFSLRLGRQLIDTPFADTDEIRIHPNSFEAAMLTYMPWEGTTFTGGYITRWAGYDSEDTISKDKYKKLAPESDGAYVAGVVSENVEDLALQAWFYGVDNYANLAYADALYGMQLSEDLSLEVGGQVAYFKERKDADGVYSGVDGSVYGVGATLGVYALSLGAAYNLGSNGDGDVAALGFGGGPFMTSMEEWTIDGMNDVKAYQLSAELDMESFGLKGLEIATFYGNFKSSHDGTKVDEIDCILSYAYSDSLYGDISYAMIDDKNANADGGSDAGYNRFLARVTYAF